MLKLKLSRAGLLGLCALMIVANLFVLVGHSSAASLTNSYIKLNRMKAATDSTFRLVFKTTSSAGATGLTINFGSSWTTNSGTVSTTQAISGVSGCDVSATALPGGSLAASGSSSTITVTSITALSASTVYCADFTTAAAVHNPTAGTYNPVVTETGGATDSTTLAVSVVSNDQITVSATVSPTFSFALSTNTDSFTGALSSSAATATTGVTLTVNTNAKNGWYAWVADSNTGLTSTLASKTIASLTPGSADTLSNGAEGYIFMPTTTSGGTGGCTTPSYGNFNSNGTTTGSGLNSTLTQFASCTSGSAINTQISLKEGATITGGTAAASDYTDLITVIGAGNF